MGHELVCRAPGAFEGLHTAHLPMPHASYPMPSLIPPQTRHTKLGLQPYGRETPPDTINAITDALSASSFVTRAAGTMSSEPAME